REGRTLWTIAGRPNIDADPPFAVLLVRDDDQARVLERLFARREDALARWQAHAVGRRRRERAESLPVDIQPPPDCLQHVSVARHGMKGLLWLPNQLQFSSGVVVGDDAKVIGVVNPVPLLPSRGLIKDVAADDEFERPQLSGSQRRYLESRVIYLYSRLLDAHRRDVERPDRGGFLDPDLVRARSDRLEALRIATTSLIRARLRREGFDAILGNLERRLRETPLFRLETGRLISADVAEQIRPPELLSLGIWDPSTPSEADLAKAAAAVAAEEERRRAQAAEQAAEAAMKAIAEDGEDELEVGDEVTSFLVFEPDSFDSASESQVEPVVDVEAELVATLRELAKEEAPDPVGVLLERIREELRMVRQRDASLLTEGLLDNITAQVGSGRQLLRIDDKVIFDSENEHFVRALRDPDPAWVSFLASAAYTALNTWLESVSNEDELTFHAVHAELLLSSLLTG
ncbi:MAG: hypothetical protein KC431_21410, partial [Myxococcales bacterium]|nr:hypothetical protein [Myxococcales bacterium]